MTEYKVVVADLESNTVEELPALNLMYSSTLNSAGNCHFVMPKNHSLCTPGLLAVGEREIHVLKGTTRVWGGYLWTAESGGEDKIVRFGAAGWKSRLDKRAIARNYNFQKVEQIDIVWALIDYTQNREDLGITRDSNAVPSGILRDREYIAFERKSVGEEMEAFTELIDGFDFDISPNKVWTPYYPQKGRVAEVIFENSRENKRGNIRNFSVQYDATNVRSNVTGFGDGLGDEMLIYEHENTATRSRYGLIEGTVSVKDIRLMDTLKSRVQEEQFVTRHHRLQPQISVQATDTPVETFEVGDQCLLRIDEGYDQIDGNFRIISKVVSLSNAGSEIITVFFERAR